MQSLTFSLFASHAVKARSLPSLFGLGFVLDRSFLMTRFLRR